MLEIIISTSTCYTTSILIRSLKDKKIFWNGDIPKISGHIVFKTQRFEISNEESYYIFFAVNCNFRISTRWLSQNQKRKKWLRPSLSWSNLTFTEHRRNSYFQSNLFFCSVKHEWMVIKIWRLFVILIGLFCAHVGDNYVPNTWNILAHDVNEYYCALFADCFITKLGSLLLV